MIRLFGQSLAIFASNAPALLGITLLIYLPINVGLNLLIDESQLDDFDFTALQAYTLAELLFGTLASGFATVVAARARLGEPVRFAAAFTQSLRRWIALIGATVLFNIGFGVGLLLLVVPGVYLALRWALIYPAIVLDDAGVNHSFSRSTWLTEGVRWQILGCGLLGIVVISVLTGVLYLPLEWLPESLYFPTVVVVDTLLSWAALLWPILLTLFYLEARAADEQTDLPHDPYYEPTDGDRAVVESEDNPYRSPQY